MMSGKVMGPSALTVAVALSLACMLFIMPGAARAANDQEPNSINWNNITSTANFWYVDANDKPAEMPSKYLTVDANWIPTHVRTNSDANVGHYHVRYNYGDPNQPSKNAANRYWNKRFEKCGVPSEDASTTYNCHIWAFKKTPGNGVFNYWTDDPNTVYTADYTKRPNNNQVQNLDLERYGDNTHTTLVNVVAAQKPTSISWKWHSSGVYSYAPKPATAFDTPMCDGGADKTKTIDNQPWTWTESKAAGPNVYHR